MPQAIYRHHGIDAARRALTEAAAILSDIDGVLWDASGRPLSCVKELLRMKPSALVSNNSTLSSESIARRFAKADVPIAPSSIFLAGEFAVEFCKTHYRDGKILILASDEISALANDALNITDHPEEAAAVLICRDRTISLEKIDRAVNAIKEGAKVVLANPDFSHPADSMLRSETGAIWEAVRCQLTEPYTLHVLGKPSSPLVEKALAALAVQPENAVFIGDNPATDGAAAAKLGIPFIHAGGTDGFLLQDLLNG